MAAHFEPVMKANYSLVAPPPTRRTAIGGYTKVASYDLLGEQLHNSNLYAVIVSMIALWIYCGLLRIIGCIVLYHII